LRNIRFGLGENVQKFRVHHGFAKNFSKKKVKKGGTRKK